MFRQKDIQAEGVAYVEKMVQKYIRLVFGNTVDAFCEALVDKY
jgi:hypothetical protein